MSICDKAKQRHTTEYTELHHVIPESFFIIRTRRDGVPGWLDGNPNDQSNLVRLTAKEHYICHMLLVKMTTGQARRKAAYALHAMNTLANPSQARVRANSGAYSMARRQYGLEKSKNMIGEQNHMFGKRRTKESIEKQRLSRKSNNKSSWNRGLSMSKEHREKISSAAKGSNNPMFGRRHSAETKLQQSLLKRGKPNLKLQGREKSEAHRQKLSSSISALIWLTDGSKNKRVPQDIVATLLSQGWSLGMAKR